MKNNPLRGVYRAFVVIGVLAFLVLIGSYPIGRSLALADNAQDVQQPPAR